MKPLEYSHIYVIESLAPGEVKTGSDLFNDIIRPRMIQKELENQCRLISVGTKLEFFDALETIRKAEVLELANPIIHLEMHGNEDGLQAINGDVISWEELHFFLLQLNGICANNLFVSLATCKGGYIHKAIRPDAWIPFWGFLGPFEEVTGGEILANFSAFYDEFLQSGDFNAAEVALHQINPEGYSRFRFHNTEYIFQKAYSNYEKFHLTLEMVNQRVELIFNECRPMDEFRYWSDDKIRNYARKLVLDQDGLLKKKLMRRFFMLDQFPDQAHYYNEILA